MAEEKLSELSRDEYDATSRAANTVDSSAGGDRLDRFLREDEGMVQEEWNLQRPWREKQGEFLARRWTLLYRNPSKPWPGASNIVPPLIDKQIGDLEPAFHNLVFSAGKIVAAQPGDQASASNLTNFELWQNSIYEGHIPRYSMPRFDEEVDFINAYMLQYGVTAAHIQWKHETEFRTRTLTSTTRPGLLADLAVVPDLDDETIMALRQQDMEQGGAQNPPELLRKLRPGEQEPGPVNPMNRAAFDELAPHIRDLVFETLELDEGSKNDQAVAKDVMSWLRSGGMKPLVVSYRQITRQSPVVRAIHPNDLIVPMGVDCPENAAHLTIREHWSPEQVRAMGRDEGWQNVEEAITSAMEQGPYRMDDLIQDVEEKLLDVQTNLFSKRGPEHLLEFWRRYRILEIDGEQIRIEALYEPNGKVPLFIRELPYNHGCWPVVSHRWETVNRAWHTSRGIAELMNDADLHMTASKRAQLNSLHLATGRMFLVRDNSRLGREGMRFGPITMARTENPAADLREIDHPVAAPQLWGDEAFFHQTWVQGHIGANNNDLLSDSKLTRPRTATEAGFRNDDRQRKLGRQADRYLKFMGRIYQQVASLSQQFSPDEFLAQVSTGPIKPLRREQVQGVFNIFPVPAAGSMDPGGRAQAAFQRLQVLQSAAPLIQSSPEYSVDLAAAVKEYLDADDPRASQRLMPKALPQERLQELATLLQQAADDEQRGDIVQRILSNTGLSLEEIAAFAYEFMNSQLPFKEHTQLVQSAASEAVMNKANEVNNAAADGEMGIG